MWMIPSFAPEIQKAIIKRCRRSWPLRGREGPDGRHLAFVEAAGQRRRVLSCDRIPVPSMAVGREPGEGQDDLPPTKAEDSGADVGIHPGVGQPWRRHDGEFQRPLLEGRRAGKPAQTLMERMTMLRAFAGTLGGRKPGGTICWKAWNSLNEVHRRLEALDFGGMVAFRPRAQSLVGRARWCLSPEDLTAGGEKSYRRFLFQPRARKRRGPWWTSRAMRMYEGFGARAVVNV